MCSVSACCAYIPHGLLCSSFRWYPCVNAGALTVAGVVFFLVAGVLTMAVQVWHAPQVACVCRVGAKPAETFVPGWAVGVVPAAGSGMLPLGVSSVLVLRCLFFFLETTSYSRFHYPCNVKSPLKGPTRGKSNPANSPCESGDHTPTTWLCGRHIAVQPCTEYRGPGPNHAPVLFLLNLLAPFQSSMLEHVPRRRVSA